MTLKEYFAKQPFGAVTEMAATLGISRTWLSLVAHGRKPASPTLCILIERLTKGKVKRKVLRPDLYN